MYKSVAMAARRIESLLLMEVRFLGKTILFRHIDRQIIFFRHFE